MYVFFSLYLFFFQESYIFFPSNYTTPLPSDLPIQSVKFQTSDSLQLHGWYLDNQADKTVLFFHGNAGTVAGRVEQMEIFDALNLNALIFDYRGYGLSKGQIKREQDLYEDAEAAFYFLHQDKNIPLNQIILWGRSLGGAVAIDTAQDKSVLATIVESTFISMNAMAREQYPFFPTDLLLRYAFPSDQKIQNITMPLLIIHSSEDKTIPFSHGQALFQLASEPKQFLEIRGTHDDGFIRSKEPYMSAIQQLLETH